MAWLIIIGGIICIWMISWTVYNNWEIIQDFLRPAWDSEYGSRAMEAVKKMTDEAKLVRAAKEARCWAARKAAVDKLTNQDVLADIAKNDSDSDVRKAAVENKYLIDQSVMADIAKNDRDNNVSMAAIERITDQEIKENLLLDLIRKIREQLENSENSKNARMDAADALKTLYKRYGKTEHYPSQGTYSGGYSNHRDGHSDEQTGCNTNPCDHSDSIYSDHTDTTYSFDVKFNTEEF